MGLCRELSLKSWLQIGPCKLICSPVQHFYCCEQPVAGKHFKCVGYIRVGGGVVPPIGAGKVIDLPDEYDCRNVIFSFLAEEFGKLRLLYFKSQCCLRRSRCACLNHDLRWLHVLGRIRRILVSVVVVVIDLNVVLVDLNSNVSLCIRFSE
jgi:hypothetical protein